MTLLHKGIPSLLFYIGFMFCVAEGFVVLYRPTASSINPIPSTAQIILKDVIIQSQSKITGRHLPLHAIKEKSKISTATTTTTSIAVTTSGKINEMASFLSIKLLEKVMTEAMKVKDDGESNMDLEAVERITKALQMSSSSSRPAASETKKAQEEDEIQTVDELDMDMDMDLDLDRLGTKTKQSIASEMNVPAPKLEETQSVIGDAPLPNGGGDNDDANSSSSSSSSSQIDVVAKEEENFIAGRRRPLEIIASDIPPLRPSSIPQRNKSFTAAEEKNEATQPEEIIISEEEVVVAASEDSSSTQKKLDSPEEEEEVVHETASSILLERQQQRAEELFQRRLLKKKLEYVAAAAMVAKVVDVIEETSNSEKKTTTAQVQKELDISSKEEVDPAGFIMGKQVSFDANKVWELDTIMDMARGVQTIEENSSTSEKTEVSWDWT